MILCDLCDQDRECLQKEMDLYALDASGSVCFADVDASAAIDAAHRVRSAQFPWYFLQWNPEKFSEGFANALRHSDLAFFIEYHESGTWFCRAPCGPV